MTAHRWGELWKCAQLLLEYEYKVSFSSLHASTRNISIRACWNINSIKFKHKLQGWVRYIRFLNIFNAEALYPPDNGWETGYSTYISCKKALRLTRPQRLTRFPALRKFAGRKFRKYCPYWVWVVVHNAGPFSFAPCSWFMACIHHPWCSEFKNVVIEHWSRVEVWRFRVFWVDGNFFYSLSD